MNSFTKLAALAVRRERINEQRDRLFKEYFRLGAALQKANVAHWSTICGTDRSDLHLRVPLADYLRHFAHGNHTPKLCTFTENVWDNPAEGEPRITATGTKRCMEYGPTWAGDIPGKPHRIHVWVTARTEPVWDEGDPKPVPATPAPAEPAPAT